ncbi:hypothetical protein [Roseibium sediminis]|uniref:hypothetical protein n=1 Tax=Roseibium sediminis TaxID=1775174 RepID=UPI00123DFF4D|nr:hypothetical protein [Roseibium sediminis]
MNKKLEEQEKKQQEALRAIDRVQAESETIVGSTFVRMADRAQKHMSAADKNSDDPVEIWGTRIGRAAGLIFAVGLVIYLFKSYL